MACAEEHPHEAPIGAPRAAPIRVTCPHCGNPLDIVPMLARPVAATASPGEVAAPLAGRIGRAALSVLERGLFPVSAVVEHPHEQSGRGAGSPVVASPWSWGVVVLVVLGIALIGALLIWLGRPAGLSGSVALSPTTEATRPALEATNASSLSVDEAAIRDTLTRYNAAETEAAALLRIDPLQPYLAPEGPAAARRTAELAERKRRNAPHRSLLVRWGIGEITLNGDSATAVTQETWSNQEAGAVAPEQATVRITYTLRRDATRGRWLIVDTSQMLL